MSEGMHSNPVNAGNRSRSRIVLAVGGTALAVLVAGLSIQVFRAKPGAAVEAEGSATLKSAGRSRGEQSDNPPMAKVGPLVITREMVARECIERYGAEALDKLINRALIQVACTDRGVDVKQEEVTAEVDRIAKRFNLDSRAWLQMLKAERNISQEQYARDVIWPMLALKKLAGPEAKVTDEELQKAFVRNYGPRVECKMIMFDNFGRAQAIWKETEGITLAEFGTLARKHSVEPTSRALDGDVPAIPRFSGNQNLEEKAFALKPNEISGIIEIGTPDNKKFAILMCKGKTKPLITDISDVRKELYEQVKEEKTQELVAKTFEQIKEEYRVDNYTLNTTSGGAASDKGIRPTSGTAPRGPAREGAPRNATAPRTQPN